MIIENLSLTQLKDFLVEQNLWTKYTALPRQSEWNVLTSPDGMDIQAKDADAEVCTKFWIQYFPFGNVFALNVNFFANLDGAPINAEDFKQKLPSAVKPYEYYKGLKIRWVYNKEQNIYTKVKPEVCTFNAYPLIDTIIPVE